MTLYTIKSRNMRMKIFQGCSFVLAGLSATIAQPLPEYIHSGQSNWDPFSPPSIDAVRFINFGEFDVQTDEFPYDFQNTLFFTNQNIMTGGIGFRFDHTLPNGSRLPADTFYNAPNSFIYTYEPGFGFIGGGSIGLVDQSSQLLVNSTNIVNKGFLSGGGNGLLSLKGQNIDLSRSGLEVRPVESHGSLWEIDDDGNRIGFYPDVNIYDVYWGLSSDAQPPGKKVIGVGNNLGLQLDPFNPSRVISVSTPGHEVTNLLDFRVGVINPYAPGFAGFDLVQADGYANLIEVDSTNWVRQAVFVANSFPNVANDVRFFRSSDPTNYFSSVMVELSTTITNTISGGDFVQTLYMVDTMAAETNFTVVPNLLARPPYPTFFPTPYNMERESFQFGFGAPAQGQLTEDFFFPITNSEEVVGDTTTTIDIFMASAFATNRYTAYGAYVTNIAIPFLQNSSATNLPGRLEIVANSGGALNLDRTRIRAEGDVIIETDNLLSSNRANVDSQNLTFDLQSTSGNLVVESLARDTVERFAGSVYMYSAQWTNSLIQITNSIGPDPEGEPDEEGNIAIVTNTTSNTVSVGYHVLMVDGQMDTVYPVIVNNFKGTGTNVTIRDNMSISETFLLDTDSFTLDGVLTLGSSSLVGGTNFFIGGLQNFDSTVAPGLKYFTNNGALNVGLARFGDQVSGPMERVVNTGVISAGDQSVYAKEFTESGQLITDGRIIIESDTAKLQSGTMDAAGNVILRAKNVKMLDYEIFSGASLIIDSTDSFVDNGPESGNVIQVNRGFQMLQKPNSGNLLGTSLATISPQFSIVPHIWAAEDFGAVARGYENNSALGRLVLEIRNAGTLSMEGLPGDGIANAIYVDYLEIGPDLAEDFEGGLETKPDPNNPTDDREPLTIYFADSNMPIEGPDGLDGKLGGSLVWVSEFAGPNSSVDVLTKNGETVRLNRVLRNSPFIDSDDDGIANRDDFYPLDALVVEIDPFGLNIVFVGSESKATISWDAVADINYIVEFATTLSDGGNWQILDTVQAQADGPITFEDSIDGADSYKYYRVSVSQE
jgi:hypothetical protein